MNGARYVGRPASASPSTGSAKVHQQEQEAIVAEALGTDRPETADAPPGEPAA